MGQINYYMKLINLCYAAITFSLLSCVKRQWIAEECFMLQKIIMDSHLLDMMEINEGMFKVHNESN